MSKVQQQKIYYQNMPKEPKMPKCGNEKISDHAESAKPVKNAKTA